MVHFINGSYWYGQSVTCGVFMCYWLANVLSVKIPAVGVTAVAVSVVEAVVAVAVSERISETRFLLD